MLTHIVRHIFQTARPTNFKRGIPMEDDDRISLRRYDLQGQTKVNVTRSRDQSESSWPNAVSLSLEADRAYRVGRTRRPHFLLVN